MAGQSHGAVRDRQRKVIVKRAELPDVGDRFTFFGLQDGTGNHSLTVNGTALSVPQTAGAAFKVP